MSCRYPGEFARRRSCGSSCTRGVDAIGAFPTDRGWDLEGLYDPDPDRPGTSYTREGGFVHDVGEFDAGFFGISPREALAMDPQQRILLEVCWEALERAGIDPHVTARHRHRDLRGYQPESLWTIDLPGELEGYQVTPARGKRGKRARGILARAWRVRRSSVDTACSSSLVALHLACGALRAGRM